MADEINSSPIGPGPNDDGPLPTPGVPVWVQCGGLRVVAYRDTAGLWRSYARGQELKPPVRMFAAILPSRARPWPRASAIDLTQQMLSLLSCILYPLTSSDALPL